MGIFIIFVPGAPAASRQVPPFNISFVFFFLRFVSGFYFLSVFKIVGIVSKFLEAQWQYTTNNHPRWSSFIGIEPTARIEQKRNDFPTSPDVHGLIGCYVFYEVSGHPTPEPRKIHPPHGPHQPIAVDPEEGRRRRCGRVRTTIQAATTRL